MLFSEELMVLTFCFAHGSHRNGFLPLLKWRWVCSALCSQPLWAGRAAVRHWHSKPTPAWFRTSWFGLNFPSVPMRPQVWSLCQREICFWVAVWKCMCLCLNPWGIQSKLPDIHIGRTRPLTKVSCECCYPKSRSLQEMAAAPCGSGMAGAPPKEEDLVSFAWGGSSSYLPPCSSLSWAHTAGLCTGQNTGWMRLEIFARLWRNFNRGNRKCPICLSNFSL